MILPLVLLMLTAALPASAQIRSFNCVGAERMEDDVFSIPFARGSSRVTDAARSGLASVQELMKGDPDRVACILGHSGQEGGATTSIRLAAERARAVAQALSAQGIERDRLRAEARSAQFSPRLRDAVPASRTVTIVVLPAPEAAAPARPPAEAPAPEPAPAPARDAPPR